MSYRAVAPQSDMCLNPGPRLGPSVRLQTQARRWWKDTGSLSEGGWGAGLGPTTEQRRTPWSHWPNFRRRNTTQYVCEKRGAWVRICGLWFFILLQATRPGLGRVWLLVPLSVLSLFKSGWSCSTECAHKCCYDPLLQPWSPWYCRMTLYSADLAST